MRHTAVVCSPTLPPGEEFNKTELFTPRFSIAAGRTWSAVNGNARQWLTEQGLGLQGRYSTTRCEATYVEAAAVVGVVPVLTERLAVSGALV